MVGINRDIDHWESMASLLYNDVPTDETFAAAHEAAANIMSGLGFLDAPELFEQLILVGYAQALRDVRDGDYDDQIQGWRSLTYSGDQ